MFLTYGFTIISFAYCLSHVFKTESKATSNTFLICIVTGFLFSNIVFILEIYPSMKDFSKFLKALFRVIFPPFTFCSAMMNMSSI